FRYSFFLFFHFTPITLIYILSLHDVLPILSSPIVMARSRFLILIGLSLCIWSVRISPMRFAPEEKLVPVGVLVWRWYEYWKKSRSEEHTSELQSRGHLVCRLLLEKKRS